MKTSEHSGNSELGLKQKADSSQCGILLERISYENTQVHDKAFTLCHFDGVNLKGAQLTNVTFSHSRFTDCYFKNASLTRVRFIDCFFDHCDFDGAVLSGCGFEYSEFRNSRIVYDQIESCLPRAWQNVLFRLARSLRVNAHSVGDYGEYRKFLSLELMASETHYKQMFTKYDGYYKKYRPIDRLRAAREWATMRIDRFLWGHGEHWTRVLLVGGALVVGFAFLFRYGTEVQNMPTRASFWNYLAFSASNFMTLTYDNAVPADGFARFLQISEAALGLLFFGLLVTSLYVRISKR